MNAHDPDARPDDLHRALAAVGDQLESAVAAAIVDEAARNNGDPARHLLHVHHNGQSPLEEPMTIDTPDTTEQPPAVAAPPRRSRRKVAAIGLAAAVVAAGGVAAASGLLSTDAVERGMPGGAAIFDGTEPSCSSNDGIVFDCVLTSSPTPDASVDHTGSAQLIVDDHATISGGCRGVDAAGLRWTCYVGERAVEEGILSADLLGQPSTGPSHG